MPHVAQLNCDQVEVRGSSQRAPSPLTDERAGDDGSHGFQSGASARLILKASDLRASPVGVVPVRQILPLQRLPAEGRVYQTHLPLISLPDESTHSFGTNINIFCCVLD